LRYVPYGVPDSGVVTWLPSHAKPAGRNVSAAILELSGKVLPGVGDTVRVAERVRGRLMRYFEQRFGEDKIPSMVHGKDAKGNPLKDHSHLFILPRGNRLGRIDHVLIYTRAEGGFTPGIEDAIAKVHMIRWIESVRCVASWVGRVDDREVRPVACQIKSSTPFVTVRHWRKGRGSFADFVKAEISRECENHGLPKPLDVTEFEMPNLLRFRRSREGEPSRPGYALEIEFAEPVQTPFSLGYGCHFGLGQFEGA
jgi:CRISPR-associated protein Csb2